MSTCEKLLNGKTGATVKKMIEATRQDENERGAYFYENPEGKLSFLSTCKGKDCNVGLLPYQDREKARKEGLQQIGTFHTHAGGYFDSDYFSPTDFQAISMASVRGVKFLCVGYPVETDPKNGVMDRGVIRCSEVPSNEQIIRLFLLTEPIDEKIADIIVDIAEKSGKPLSTITARGIGKMLKNRPDVTIYEDKYRQISRLTERNPCQASVKLDQSVR